MYISHLNITNVRNLVSNTIKPSEFINVLYGENGSGKTSFLEGIYFLGVARSFRNNRIRTVISKGQSSLLSFAKIKKEEGEQELALGVERYTDGSLSMVLDKTPLQSISELIGILPLQLINPGSFELLEGSPKIRRQFLDWGVFHVEPYFYSLWKITKRCINQRNHLLKKHGKIDSYQLDLWNGKLSSAATRLHNMRLKYIRSFTPCFEEVLSKLINIPGLHLDYYSGWDKSSELLNILKQNEDMDKNYGYTRQGPHRADIRFKVGNNQAVDVLSRGQQKLVICAVKIAQGIIYNKQSHSKCVYLVDDLASELDQKHRNTLYSLLSEMGSQVFITSVDKMKLDPCWSAKKVKMFHVKQGQICETESS